MIRRLCVLAAVVAFTLSPAWAQEGDPVRFADLSVLNVDATSLDLRLDGQPPHEYPQVGHLSPVTFEQALRAWTETHFNLTGNSVNSFRVTLRQGGIVEKLLPVKKGIMGWFKKEQSAEYEASLEVELALIDVNGQVLSSTSGKAWLTRTVPEGTTDTQRRATWREMVKAAFDNLDKEILPNARQYMSAYVK